MNTKVKILKTLLFACLIIVPGILFAQGGFDDDVLDNPVPFDGGVTLLIAAGLGYGIKKAREQRQAEQK